MSGPPGARGTPGEDGAKGNAVSDIHDKKNPYYLSVYQYYNTSQPKPL